MILHGEPHETLRFLKKKEMKLKAKIAKKSSKYLNRTADELGKMIKADKTDNPEKKKQLALSAKSEETDGSENS